MISQRIVYTCLVAHAQPALALVAPPLLTAPRSVSCNIVTPLRGPAATADELEYGRGTMADLSSIVTLAKAEFGKDYTDPVSKFGLLTLLTVGFWIRLCRDDHSILTCKDASNDLIGYVEVSPQPAGEVSGPFPLPKWAKGLMGPLTPYLANLLVRPDARRRGVGGALVVACEQEAASWGDGVLGLHHDRTDQKLVRFYRKLGFAGDGVPLKHQGFELVYVAKRVRPS